MISFSKIAVFLFGLIALLHLLRLVFKVSVVIGTCEIPQWLSIGGFFLFLILSIGMWKESKSNKGS